MGLDDFGDWEHCTRIEPARDVVTRGVVEQRFGRDVEHLVLEILEVADAHHFFAGFGVANYESAEAEIVVDGITQVDGKFFAVFVEKRCADGFGMLFIASLRRLDDDGHIRVAATNFSGKFNAGELFLCAID